MKKLFLLTVLLTSAALAFAQKGGVRGNVYEKSNGSPVASAIVSLEGSGQGAVTDFDGFYSISEVKPGDYKLVVRYVGYDSIAQDISIQANKVVNQAFYIEESATELSGVEINADKETKKSEVKISVTTVTPRQISQIPSVGGTPDLAQYLQVIPGVVFTGDQGGQLYIRGGAPVQNKVLLDGMTIYNPFHSIGFYSVFETDIIRSVDVYTGGFGAEYGGRTSAVIDVNTREGNKIRHGGKIEASPFAAKAVIEGPLMKMDKKGNSVSFLLTGKHSYLDQTSKVLYSYANENGLPFAFTDVYGKVSYNAGNGSKINMFGFNFKDNVTVGGVTDYKWNSSGGGANFRIVPGEAKILLNGVFAYSKYKTELTESDGKPRFSSVSAFNGGFEINSFVKQGEIRAGIDVTGFTTDFSYFNTSGSQFTQNENTTEIGFYAKYRQKIGHVVIDPGIRIQYYASLGGSPSIEPRLGIKWNVTEDFRLKAAGGLYSQSLISATNERDIVNFFQGFLAAPDEEVYKPNSNETVKNKWQNSYHAIVGAEIDLPFDIEMNVEPYWKSFPRLIGINRQRLVQSDPNFVTESGEAYGIDFNFKYNKNDLYVYLAYSIGHVTRDDGDQVYPTHFDRRHNVNFVTTYNFSFKKDAKVKPWEVSVRWNLGSGFPFSLTQGFYQQYNFPGGISSNYVGDRNDLGIIYDDNRNAGRLPYYHRLDIGIKRVVQLGKHSKLELSAGITNAYNRANVFYVDRITRARVNQLPALPSLAASFTF